MSAPWRDETVGIQRTDLAEQVYQLLRQRIFTAALQPGDKVRPESVAQELGVSRTPVVEAINRLAEHGLVVMQPRRSTFVSNLSLERVIALFDVRLMMEEFGARRGVARATDHDIERFRLLLTDEEALIDGDSVTDYLAWLRINREFHQACIDLAANPVLSELHARLNIDIVMARAFRLATLRNSRDVHSEHVCIVRGYEHRDAEALLAAVVAHLSRGRDAYAMFVQSRDGG
jgi:GntR family transcriptional regulator, rspAB operon transcriptional repressor